MNIKNSNSPYPGLRPFTEQEAIFFKGRDSHIDKIQKELLDKKFLMVTGASGDGKSSLIYAGLLPKIKAGFVRSDFGKWAVAILRPGIEPYENLADSLQAVLKLNSGIDAKEKLAHGYSALIDLYKSSERFLNINDDNFLKLEEKEQIKAKRKASNLLIVVDQFEEFFTNDSNFNKETAIPSLKAQLAMNLLIETARISVARHLPVFIVCTMRSDYIGSAPSYRGLPELIGNNQFFVPRLNREEIVSVIEDPAILNGNKIAPRLTQRLINDLNVVNTDVLPSLQHALRRIWSQADNGSEELDLIHYAMAGGMNLVELPEESHQKYNGWFDKLPEYHRVLVTSSNDRDGISNVLNHHADLLFETAYTQCKGEINKESAQSIISRAFKCLTQIDDSRAVRNRMTIDEICRVINSESVSDAQIYQLIDVYRQQGNNFIYPFINIENKLASSTLLDITHEALIRNWDKLMTWTKEEYDDVIDYKEINTASRRWNEGGRKTDDLLNSGTYNYFITKHGKSIPSEGWMYRYVEESLIITDGIATKTIDEIKLSSEERINLAKTNRSQLKKFMDATSAHLIKIRRVRKMVLSTISTLCIVSILGFFWAYKEKAKSDELKNDISNLALANAVATKASMMMDKNPTKAFRIAELAYQMSPTDLSKQVLMNSYLSGTFYSEYNRFDSRASYCEYAPNNMFILAISYNHTVVIDPRGKLLYEHDVKVRTDFNPCVGSISYNSKYIAYGSIEGDLYVVDVENKSVIFNVRASDDGIRAVQFANHSNKLLVSTNGGEIIKYDLNAQRETIRKTIHNGPIRYAKYSPDDKYILSISKEKKLHVMDTNLQVLNSLSVDYRGWFDANFSPLSSLIVSSSFDGIGKLWNYKTNKVINLIGHKDVIRSANFSSNGKYIVTSSIDNNAIIWDTKGNLIKKLVGHKAKLWSAVFSPDNKHIATSSDDGTAIIWDLDGNQENILKGHTSQLHGANFSHDGNNIVSCSADNTLKIWNINPRENNNLNKHFSWVDDACFSSNGKYIVTVGYDYTAKLWTKNGKYIRNIARFRRYGGYHCAITSDSKKVVITANDGYVRIVNIEKNDSTIKCKTNGVPFKINITKDGQYFHVTSHGQGSYSTVYTIEGKEISSVPSYACNISALTNEYFTVLNDTNLIVRYLIKRDGLVPIDTIKVDNKVLKISVAPDGKTVFVQAPSKNISKYALKQGKFQKQSQLQSEVGIHWIWFDYTGEKYVIEYTNSRLEVRDFNDNILAQMRGHNGVIMSLEFTSDGEKMITSSEDLTIKIWNFKTGECLLTIPGHKALIVTASFSPDGKSILSASNDMTARLIPATIEELLHKINVEKILGETYELDEFSKMNYRNF